MLSEVGLAMTDFLAMAKRVGIAQTQTPLTVKMVTIIWRVIFTTTLCEADQGMMS